ncbi:MAG: hypothetical protein WCI45_09620, partial [Desulfuromonadales bacterium]
KLKMAEQALKSGIVEILPFVSAADKAGGLPMADWKDVVKVAGMSARMLVIDQEKLEAMQIVKRSSFILQKRVDVLKALRVTNYCETSV